MESLENEVLQKIKFALLCKNEGIALRLLEQYRFDITEEMHSEEEVKHIISEALQSALVKVDLEQWFKQFKKK